MMTVTASAARVLCVALGAALCTTPTALAESPASIPIPQPRPEKHEAVFGSYKKEVNCLAKALYFEARGEPVVGQIYVARVILNRVDSPFYPPTICKVVYQNDHMKNACQFSFACDGIADRIVESRAFKVAMSIAKRSFGCDKQCRDRGGAISRSTHYHAITVDPWWAGKLERTGKIGNHVFYYTATL